MVDFEELLAQAEHLRLEIHEESMPERMKGLCGNNVIWLNKNIPTTAEKTCVLAEEISHYLTTVGDITDQRKTKNRKQEKLARRRAYERLIPVSSFIKAYHAGIQGRHELAEFLGVTEDFLGQAIQHYKEKYGPYYRVDSYYICFEPLAVIEVFTEGREYREAKIF